MFKKITLYGIFSVLLLIVSSNFALAQEYRGTITGKVTDPNGSVVPDATVVVKNVATNIETTIKTNEDGTYVVPLLLPGKYSVSVNGNGFKTTIREQINLNVSDRLNVDFQLEVGTESQQVTVVADTELVERGSVTTGTVVTQREIEELPLSEGAAYNLATQSPGVTYTGNPQFTGPTSNSNLAAFRTNGVGSNLITLDGSPNLAIDGAVAYTPPSDAVSQFKIQTSSFDSQNGFTAGSTVNVAVKNGTNKFHGGASYFDRSKALTANNFYSNRSGQERPDRHYYRYGGQVNGPIIKDKTFFMGSYEQQYNKIPAAALFSVPTAKMRIGDFSEVLSSGIIIYDPASAAMRSSTCTTTGTQNTVCRLVAFTDNKIPDARINQAAKNFLAKYPLPNLPGVTNNYFSNNTNILPYKTYLTRIDHNINNDQRIFGKFFWSKSRDDKFNFLETDDAFTRGYEYRTNKGGNVNYTATISSNLVFDLRGNMNDFVQQRLPANPLSAADLGFTGIAAITDSTMGPRINFTNFETFGPQRSDYNEGLTRDFSELSIQPTFTQIWGDHTLKYGYDIRRLWESRITNGNNAGNFTFTGTFTSQASNSGSGTTTGSAAVGRDLATFLLGIPTSGTIEKPVTYNVNSLYQGVFIQDDWRINQKLTVNLGFRYEVETAVREADGKLVIGFDPTLPSPLQAPVLAKFDGLSLQNSGIPRTAFQNLAGGLVFADSAKAPQQKSDKNNIQPRFGVSYAITDKMVIRGGFGIFTAPFQLAGIAAAQAQIGFSASTTFTPTANNGLTFTNTLDNPFTTINPATGASLGSLTSVGTTLGTVGATGATAAVLPNERKNSNYYRAVLGIQRELPWKIGVEATAVYSRGYDLPVLRQLNYIPANFLNNLAGVTDSLTLLGDGTAANTGKIATVNTFLTTTVSNPFFGVVPTSSPWNTASLARNRLLTAFPQFQDLVTTEYNGTSDYASLQLQATKRFAKGLSLNSSYTFSYDHEKVRRLNPQDAELTDMISTGSRPHRFAFSGIYELPIGKKKWLGRNWNGWLDAVFGGWQLQGVYEWQSGEPLILPNVFYSGDPTKLKNLLGEKDAQGRRYGVDIPAFDLTGFTITDARATINGSTNANFNKQVVPAFGNNYSTTGQNTLRYMPYVLDNFRNQPFQKFDAGLTKNFTIREGMKLQVRVEGINVLNWVYLTGLNVTPSVGATSTFGFANAQRNLPRDIQLGARFSF